MSPVIDSAPAATALGAGLGSGLMALTRDPEQMALAPAARVFRSALAAREPALDVSHAL